MTLSEYKLTQKPDSPAFRYLEQKEKTSLNCGDEKVHMCHSKMMAFLNFLNTGVLPTGGHCSKAQ